MITAHTTWEVYLLEHEYIDRLDQHHTHLNEIIDEMGNCETAGQLETAARIRRVAILNYSSGKRCIALLLHNLECLMDCLGGNPRYVALVGFDENTASVFVSGISLFETSKYNAPNLENLLKMNTEDEFLVQWDASEDESVSEHDVSNAIVLAPWILRAIVIANTTSVAKIFMCLKQANLQMDTILHYEDCTDKDQSAP